MHIRFENLSFRYHSFGGQPVAVLRNINFEIKPGELVGIAGPSGSGKTTLMQHFTGLLKPNSGRVLIEGKDIWTSDIKLSELRRQIGLVFQFPEAQLFEETVFDDVAFGLRNLNLPEPEIARRVEQALSQVGLDFESFRGRSPIYLSAGEKRRAALAGVLVMAPAVLVLDEPTAALDYPGVQATIQILRAFHASGKTVVCISHQLDLLFTLVERMIVLHRGEIAFDGPVREIILRPAILEAAGLSSPRIVRIMQYLEKKGRTNRGAAELFDSFFRSRAGVLKQSNG